MNHLALDEAYTRLHATGPEFDGWLSNHGPMVAEALVRRGHGDDLQRWLDDYGRRLETAPTPAHRIDDWQAALGDARRLGDWLGFFDERLGEDPWTQVLQTWWPRLVPGIAAGATHGVIRIGHAVRVLRDEGQSRARIAELAQGLGYWAARWQPIPGAATTLVPRHVEAALGALPTVPEQAGGVRTRLAQLEQLGDWATPQDAAPALLDPDQFLRALVTASLRRYATHAHGNPVMLVHAATAPNAVLRVLASLPREQWASSAAAAWSASAAIHAAYAPRSGRTPQPVPPTPADAFDRAAGHGDEHVIKLADTALDAYAWTGDETTLTAAATAAALIPA